MTLGNIFQITKNINVDFSEMTTDRYFFYFILFYLKKNQFVTLSRQSTFSVTEKTQETFQPSLDHHCVIHQYQKLNSGHAV